MKLLHALHLEGDNSRARWSGHLGLDLHVELRAPVGAIHRKEKNHGDEESDEETQEGQETAGDEAPPFAEFLEDGDEILDPKSGLTRRDNGAGTPTKEKSPTALLAVTKLFHIIHSDDCKPAVCLFYRVFDR